MYDYHIYYIYNLINVHTSEVCKCVIANRSKERT